MIMVIAVICALVVVLSIEGLAVMYLWNYLAPSVIPLHDISFFQSVAVVVLTSILFGNILKGTQSSGKSLSDKDTKK